MIKLVFKILLGLCCLPMWAWAQAPIKIGPKSIPLERFKADYQRLKEADSLRPDNKAAFLKEYLDYHYKILAAEQGGLLQDLGFQEEFKTFRKELAQPYMVDGDQLETLIREAYQRMKDEKLVAHLFVKLPSNPSPSDTLVAFRKIEQLHQQLLAGSDFAALAKQFSEDPASAPKGGQLGYITSLQTQYAFENAVYALPLDGFSKPFRTPSGYHIVKLLAQRPNQGKIRLAQILISVKVDASNADQVEAKKKIDLAAAYLSQGNSFEEVCQSYSEDPYSRGRGGEIRRWYFSSDLTEELQDKLFGLQRLGDISSPIRTNLGWHIFKLLDKRPLLGFEEMAEYIKQKVQTDPERAQALRAAFLKRIMKENQIQIQASQQAMAMDRFDRDRVGDEAYLQFELLKVGDKTYTIKDFYQFIFAQQKLKLKAMGYLPNISVKEWFDAFVEQLALSAEEQNLEKKYPAFKEQMDEFLEGSLFSKVMEKEVFEPSLDTLKHWNLYQSQKAMYQLPQRALAKWIVADNEKTFKDAMELLKKAPYPMNKRFPDIGFALGRKEWNANGNKLSKDLLNLMLKNPDYVLEIIGHHDASEADTLDEARIQTLAKFLIAGGLEPTRIKETENGKISPISKTDKVKNARLSFKLYSQSMEDVALRFNSIKPNSLVVKEAKLGAGEEPWVDAMMPWKPEIREWVDQGKYVHVEIKQVEAARLKSIDEVRSALIRQLQSDLEKKWLQSLRQQYPASVNEELLNQIMN